MRPAVNLTGRRFGRLEVVARSGSEERGKATWTCNCDCGNTAVIVGYNLTRGGTQSCGCLVGLVRRRQPATLYDGLTLAEHAERSGISFSTLDKRVRKYGEPFPAHLDKTRAEQELRVFEQDRKNNRRTKSRRMGAAAAWHRKDGVIRAPEPVTDIAPGTDEQRAAFVGQHASQAAAQHSADRVAPKGPMRERWGFNPGPAVRPSRRERGLK
jgi:transcriptional regulator with XRE-family HTH domain